MFQAGFARVDVTPPLGTPMTGYFARRLAEGILDPLELNAVALKNGEDTVVFITGDFMYVVAKEVIRYRELIAEETGLPLDCVLYQTIHQHTSTTCGANAVISELYQKMLCRKFCDVAKMALADLSDAKISYAEKETAEPVAFIRRFRMKDGSVRTNPGVLNPDIDHPLDEADNTVRLVKFEREGKKDIALVGFQNHPDMIGGKKFSADWPGFVRRMTEKRLANTHCIVINGCQGDVNHINVKKESITKGLTRNTPEWIQKRYEFCQHVATVITDAAVELWDQTEAVDAGEGIFTKVVTKNFLTRMDGAEYMEKCKVLKEKILDGAEETKHFTLDDKGEISRIAQLENKALFQKIPVTVLAFGKIAILGYAGEPFTEYAVDVRKQVPELHLLTSCLTNGAEGYLPSKKAFAEGGYEVRASNFPKELPEVLQKEALEILREYIGK